MVAELLRAMRFLFARREGTTRHALPFLLRYVSPLLEHAMSTSLVARTLMASIALLAFLGTRASTRGEEADDAAWVRSARSGAWSNASTWEGGKLPAAGDRVHIRAVDDVTYDVESDAILRTVFVGGKLRFASDRDTRLCVGLLRVDQMDCPSEEGFDYVHFGDHSPADADRATLQIGSPDRPIEFGKRAVIRLYAIEGQNPESCPAVICCGGRMDIHGAPMNRTWVKLGATAKEGDATVTLAEKVSGWRVSDRVIVTATRDEGPSEHETEERTIVSLEEEEGTTTLTLDQPLKFEHLGEGDFRGEVANLSRNVVVESAEPGAARGHTMYHRDSAGAISYAEFRDLGKKNVLGRYSLHYHLVGDTMRGSYVIGASIHDSENRWLTVHGTNHLVVRDCVGYRSVGHGFYLEDGTEVDNVFDRNLAVQAFRGKKLPKQVLPFDANDGAGYWWSNSRNAFTRNVSCENDKYGYRFEATKTSAGDVTFPIRKPDGSVEEIDVRTLPFVLFSENEAHCDGLYGVNLGEGVDRVGPDERHPFVLRDTKIWAVHYAFRVQSPCVLVEGMTMHDVVYGVYHPNFDRHVYRDLTISYSGRNGDAEPFNRGHDDLSIQYGRLAVERLTFAGFRHSDMPLIQISDDDPTGEAESHFREVRVIDRQDRGRRALANRGGGPRPAPKTSTGVPIYLHDYYGPGRHAMIVSTAAGDYVSADKEAYSSEESLTGDESRVIEVRDVKFPKLLDPVDDLPPSTVVTHAVRTDDGWLLRGTAIDDGEVASVRIDGVEVKSLRGDFSEWEATVPASAADDGVLIASAVDAAGNAELSPHSVTVAK